MSKPRKMGPRQIERANKAFSLQVERAALAAGALKVEHEIFGVYFELLTRCGLLRVSASPSHFEAGGMVICIFEDVERANAELNPGAELQHHSGLNPYTGKWHLYLFGEKDEHTVCEAIGRHLARVARTDRAA